MPRVQLCTVSMRHVSIWVLPYNINGSRDFFKRQKILRRRISKKNLQRPKLKRDIFAETGQIFKPILDFARF